MQDFKLHRFNGYISNLYIAEYENKLLLLDTGCKSDVERIRKFCEEKLKRSVKEIGLAVVTHNHPDHAGGADMLRRLHGIRIASGAGIDLWYRGFSGFIQHKIDSILAHIVRNANKKKLQPVIFKRFVNPDHILHDGDLLPGFTDWRVIHVPGHTMHDVVIYNEKRRLLYSSDLVINVNGRYNLPIPVFFRKTMAESFRKMTKLDIREIYPAHGDMIKTDRPVEEFMKMEELLKQPHSEIARTVHRISVFTPDVWKSWFEKIMRAYRR